MNILSSLPPPSFAGLPAAAPIAADAALRGLAAPTLESAASAAPLHVGSSTAPRSIDDIERDFLAALCENPHA